MRLRNLPLRPPADLRLLDSEPLAASPTTAFVLAGGASLGAMQAGMLHALYEAGVKPDLLVGTSAGALNAAFAATRPATVDTARQLAEIWRGLRREDVFPISPRVVLGGLANRGDHLVPDTGIRALVQRHLQLEHLEDALIPVHLVSFDLLAGTEVRHSSGRALDAVLASSAIPGVLPPVRQEGRVLVDGGVVNNTPISHAIELGAERIYVLETYDVSRRALPAPPRGPLDAAVHAFTLLISERDRANVERYASRAELIVLAAANPGRVPPTDFEHADELIHHGRLSARRVLAAASDASDAKPRLEAAV